MEEVQVSIPGPETRAGFSGLVRLAFDAFVDARIERICRAKFELEVAARTCRDFAHEAERVALEPSR